jgi:catechol 2,3-dioxygenase-like lactoylglutathione lyase family enzyme
MALQLDHLILAVNDASRSLAFYKGILGLEHAGERGPFSVLRVSPELLIQLAPWGTKGGEHLAFSMPQAEFEGVFRRVRDDGIEYGDTFDSVGNMRGPGIEEGAKGAGKTLYFFDSDKHLIEIRHYED